MTSSAVDMTAADVGDDVELQPKSAIPTETQEDDDTPKKKPLSFYLAFLAINISTFIVSLDATALAVAIPVF